MIQVATFGSICALLEQGNVRCWGSNDVGELGYGHKKDVDVPALAGDIDVGGKVTQITVGSAHTCALLDTGKVRCWGMAKHGRLGYGNGVNIGDDETPAKAGDVNVGGKVVQVAAGGYHTCALLDTGKVRCWGDGTYGQLGYGNTLSVGDDETPADVGDVQVLTDDLPNTAARWPIARQIKSNENEPPQAPFVWNVEKNSNEDDKPSTPIKLCEARCAGCKLLFDSEHFFHRITKVKPRALTDVELRLVHRAYAQYLRSPRCVEDADGPMDPRAIGSAQDLGSVSDVIEGSFTAPGRKQTIVLFFAGHCGETGYHSENWGQRLVILIEGTQLLGTTVDRGSNNLALADLDSDGQNEVIAWGGWAGGGAVFSWIDLRSYARGAERTIANFDVDYDSCNWPPGEHWESGLWFRWDPSKNVPCFLQRKRKYRCSRVP